MKKRAGIVLSVLLVVLASILMAFVSCNIRTLLIDDTPGGGDTPGNAVPFAVRGTVSSGGSARSSQVAPLEATELDGLMIAVYSAPTIQEFFRFNWVGGVYARFFTREDFALADDGSFSFTPEHRYFTAFLYDPSAESLDKVIGVLGIDSDAGGWHLLDSEAFTSELDFGEIILTGTEDDFVLFSEVSLDGMTNLSVDTGLLEEVARMNSPVRYMKNYINLDHTMAVAVSHKFVSPGMGAWNQFSDPTDYDYRGASIGVEAMVTPFEEPAGAPRLSMEPPEEVIFISVKGEELTYGPGNPIPGVHRDYRDYGFGTSYRFGEGLSMFAASVAGNWILHDTTEGQVAVDFASVPIWDALNDRVVNLPIPVLKANLSAEQVLQSVELEWKIWNAAEDQYTTIQVETGFDKAIVGAITLRADGGMGAPEEYVFFPDPGVAAVPKHLWTFDYEAETGDVVYNFGVDYFIGDTLVMFSFNPPWNDGSEYPPPE